MTVIGREDLIERVLTRKKDSVTVVACVEGHIHEIDDADDKIRLQGYTRCPERGCLRNAWAVKTITREEK